MQHYDPNQELQLDLKNNVAYGPRQPVPVYEDLLHIRSSASVVDYNRPGAERKRGILWSNSKSMTDIFVILENLNETLESKAKISK